MLRNSKVSFVLSCLHKMSLVKRIRAASLDVQHVQRGPCLYMRIVGTHSLHPWIDKWCSTHEVAPPTSLAWTHGYDRVLHIHQEKRFLSKDAYRELSIAKHEMEALPGCLAPYEKLLSYHLLALVAHLSAEQVTAFWTDLPHTPNMLADKVVAAALCTLHPCLFKLLPPTARNQRLVCRIAFTLWDLAESVLQYAAARALIGPDGLVGRVAYADSPFAPYWAFDDPTLVTIAVGPPGRRRWHELEHAGPRAVKHIAVSRLHHKASMKPLHRPTRANGYVLAMLSDWRKDEDARVRAWARTFSSGESSTLQAAPI